MQMGVSRNEFLSASRCAIRQALVLWASIGAAFVCHGAAAQPPQVVRWDIMATVTEIDDPLGLFPDMRLGDPVRGMLKYDVSVPIEQGYISSFEFEALFEVTRMSIQNPAQRHGVHL